LVRKARVGRVGDSAFRGKKAVAATGKRAPFVKERCSLGLGTCSLD
jgi:hypothetical protein